MRGKRKRGSCWAAIKLQLNTISNHETTFSTSHVLLEVLKIVKEMSQRDRVIAKFNYDPPGVVLFDHLRIDTDHEMIQFSLAFALLSTLTVIVDKLVSRSRKVCRRMNRLPCMIICVIIVAVFQSSVWALYIGLGLLAITFNVYFISAIVLGHGIGWFFALMVAHLFKRCARNSQPGDSILPSNMPDMAQNNLQWTYERRGMFKNYPVQVIRQSSFEPSMENVYNSTVYDQ